MATPTSHPHQQKQLAASHLTPASASSPPALPSSASATNRSVPSPAYSASLKASHRPLHHRNGSAQLPAGSTPRTGGATPRPGTTSNMDSPTARAAAAMLMGTGGFGYGTGLTPRGTGLTPLPTGLTGAVGSVSGAAIAQHQEEERKRKVEVIVGMLAGKWGFVSQEGVERCATRLGLECLWEEGMGDERKRTLAVAGNGVLVEIEFGGEEVRGVVLSFPGSKDSIGARAWEGSQVLKRNLKGQGEGYVALDHFAGNLERLGRMDRLGGEEISCFDAVDGICKSLEKVFAWEIKKEKRQKQGLVEEEVICRYSGRPRMHTQGRVGLALQYWMERRLLLEQKKTDDEMDVDKTTMGDFEDDAALDIWSAIVECEASSAELYTSIRVSDTWVSEAVKKPTQPETNDFHSDESTIDWQEPPSPGTSLDAQADGAMNNNANLLQQPKALNVCFVAKFEPPIVVPFQMALQIHQSVSSSIPQEVMLSTYDVLLFADIDAKDPPLSSPRSVEKTVKSHNPTADTPTYHKHRYALFTQPQDYARAITRLPFSHPRQIIAILPVLRQWALTSTLLRRLFATAHADEEPHSPELSGNAPQYCVQASFQSIDDELAAFLAEPLPNSTAASPSNFRNVDINLSIAPFPRFNLHFPNPRYGGKLASVGFTVGLNGVFEGVDVDDGGPASVGNGISADVHGEVEEEKRTERVRMREKVKKVLEIAEDIGFLVEWMVKG
ncbi:hypothetical protein MMC28_001217 [Mycoblastus sanguinarius]|nr:hypothetical protein [Mycoblastus sanguinarius]